MTSNLVMPLSARALCASGPRSDVDFILTSLTRSRDGQPRGAAGSPRRPLCDPLAALPRIGGSDDVEAA